MTLRKRMSTAVALAGVAQKGPVHQTSAEEYFAVAEMLYAMANEFTSLLMQPTFDAKDNALRCFNTLMSALDFFKKAAALGHVEAQKKAEQIESFDLLAEEMAADIEKEKRKQLLKADSKVTPEVQKLLTLDSYEEARVKLEQLRFDLFMHERLPIDEFVQLNKPLLVLQQVLNKRCMNNDVIHAREKLNKLLGVDSADMKQIPVAGTAADVGVATASVDPSRDSSPVTVPEVEIVVFQDEFGRLKQQQESLLGGADTEICDNFSDQLNKMGYRFG